MSDDLFWPGPGADGGTGSSAHAQTEQLERTPEQQPDWTPPKKPRPAWQTAAVAGGAAALVFGAAGVGIGVALEDGGSGSPAAPGFNVSSSNTASSVNPKSYAGIAARVLPSVVSINVSGSGQQDTGSGVILRPDGYILTNNHVVSAAVNGGRVAVLFNDGSTATARIVGTDQEDDLAVIKVNKSGLPAARLGSSASVQVGDAVLAIGSPLGLTGTVTSGIVSALNRPVDTTSDQQQNPFPFGNNAPITTTVINAIQTDAAINPGNSGGPLVNANGAVIGINSAIASTSSGFGQAGNIGVGFAIPIDQAQVVAKQLIATGHASHPLMGVTLADGTDSNGNPLARVQSVTSGGPAEKAGIKVGDVVVKVGSQTTQGADAVIAAIRSHQPGDRVSVTVERDGVRKTVFVTFIDASATQG